MSAIQVLQRVRRPTASIPQVVLGVLVSLAAAFTVQFAALTAYVDLYGPGGVTHEQWEQLARPFTNGHQTWQTFGPALWAVYAVGVVLVVVRMWHVIAVKAPRAGWKYLPFVLAACAVFWVVNLDRFHL
jgi:hypothetical protein